MTTLWLHRYHLIVPAAARDAARALCEAIGPGGPSERVSFDCPLSASGALPVTHYGASGALTESMRAALFQAVQAGLLPSGAHWFRCDWDDRLVDASWAPALDRVGEPFGFADAAAAMGLAFAYGEPL